MLKNISALFLGASLLLVPATATLHAQQNIAVDLANLRQELVLAQQRLGELALRVEQLERTNDTLRQQVIGAAQSYASVSYVNESVSEANRLLRAAISQSKSDTLQQVSAQMEKLANQTNAALDSLAKSINQRRASPPPPLHANLYRHIPQRRHHLRRAKRRHAFLHCAENRRQNAGHRQRQQNRRPDPPPSRPNPLHPRRQITHRLRRKNPKTQAAKS